MKTNLLTAVVVCAAMGLLCSCGQKNEAQKAQQVDQTPLVKTALAHSEEVANTNTYTSNIKPYVTNNIMSHSTGRIVNTYVEVGDKVKKGQLLAQMDPMNLQKIILQLHNDSIELHRLSELYKVGGVSQADFDLAKLSYQLQKETRSNLQENTKLTSPINGVVTARNYDKGDLYSMQQPIFVVEQIAPVKMLIHVSERYFTMVHNGMDIDINTDAYPEETFKGKVSLIYPTIDAGTHTFAVEVTVSNEDLKLRPGMFARVTACFGSKNSIVVPDVAVVKQVGSGEHFIYVVNNDNTVKYQKVELGKRLGNRYEILSGINEGDKVVIEGQIRLKDGIAVKVNN